MCPEQIPPIENLQKITMTIAAVDLTDGVKADAHPQKVAFIYGIGSAGLTPFEYALAHQAHEGYLKMQVRRSEINTIFAHLSHSIRRHPIFATKETVDLAFQIEHIELASSSEVVRAIAEAAGCGDGCCGH